MTDRGNSPTHSLPPRLDYPSLQGIVTSKKNSVDAPDLHAVLITPQANSKCLVGEQPDRLLAPLETACVRPEGKRSSHRFCLPGKAAQRGGGAVRGASLIRLFWKLLENHRNGTRYDYDAVSNRSPAAAVLTD